MEGPLVTVFAGYLAFRGYVNPLFVLAVVVAADLTGDLALYGAGRWSRGDVVMRWSKHVGVTPRRLELVERHFARHGGKTLVAGKAMQVVGAAILFTAGAARMRLRWFVGYNLLATVPKSLALLLIGYFFGRVITQVGTVLGSMTLLTSGTLVLVVLLYVLPRRYLQRLDSLTEGHDPQAQ